MLTKLNLKANIFKPDSIGSISSTLCIIHCIITPFIFITQACTASCCASSPWWWQSLDYVFLLISFIAIRQATKTSTNQIVKIALWLNWLIFGLLIINSTIGEFYLNQNFTYAAGISLAILHLYNLRFCQCKDEKCCVN